MKSLYQRIMDTADRMEAAHALLIRMAKGDESAAHILSSMCRHYPYSGDVLTFDVEELIADVLSDAEESADIGGEG